MEKKKNHYLKKLILIFVLSVLVLSIGVSLYIDNVDNNTLVATQGTEELFQATHSGTCGTCNWEIDANGKLTIMVGTLANLSNVGDTPWYSYRTEIKNSSCQQECKN